MKKRHGFARFLWLRCVECAVLNSIKQARKTKGASVYDVNTKATGAMVHSGLSVTGMQKFTVSL